MKSETTAVIFRTFVSGGDVIALFPLEPADVKGWYCMSYQSVGQHGGATPDLMGRKLTRPSSAAEIRELDCELRRKGYKLRVLRRFPSNAFEVRKGKVNGRS